MAKVINSAALEPANKALGIAGSGDSATELLDASIDQTLDVGQIARRGLTLAGTDGVFRVILRTIHAGAGDIFVAFQPYNAGLTDGTIPPYPLVMPDKFDVWLIGASVQIVSGAGLLEAAALRLTNIQQGFGADSAGAAVVSTSVLTVAFWNIGVGSLAPAFGVTQTRLPYKTINMRIPRKADVATPALSFGTQSSGVNVFDCVIILGVFPVALGQDIAV